MDEGSITHVTQTKLLLLKRWPCCKMSQQTPDVLDDMIVLTKKGWFSKNRGCTFLFQTIGPCLFLSQQFLDSETPFFSSYSAVKVHADIESIRKGCFLLDHYPATRYMQPLSHCYIFQNWYLSHNLTILFWLWWCWWWWWWWCDNISQSALCRQFNQSCFHIFPWHKISVYGICMVYTNEKNMFTIFFTLSLK